MKCHRIIGLAILLFLAPLVYAQSVEQYSFEIDTTTNHLQQYSIKLIGAKFQYGDGYQYESNEAARYTMANFNKNTALNIFLQSIKSYDTDRNETFFMILSLTKNCKIIEMLLLFHIQDDGIGKTISKEECIDLIHSLERSELFRPWKEDVGTLSITIGFSGNEVKDAVAAFKASKHSE